MSTTTQPQVEAEETARDAIAFADAALALAGHEVTDPYLRGLLEQYLSGQISEGDYLARATDHIDKTL